MPKIEEIIDSDDEFQDAVYEAANSARSKSEATANEQLIDEIIQKQDNLQLEDEADDSDGDGDGDGHSEKFEDASAEEQSAGDTAAEFDEDAIDLEALKQRELTMTDDELQANKETADKLKLEGNELFKNDEATRSVEVYTEALKVCPTKYIKERAILYGNRAAAKIKLDLKKSAIGDCSKAIELWPEYVRALLRRAKLYENEDKLDDALSDYKRVNELDASQHEAREAMVRLPPIIQERNEKLKDEMMSKLKDLGNMILKPFGLSTTNFQMQQDPNTGSYSINFNQK